jgi:hypothetical protein
MTSYVAMAQQISCKNASNQLNHSIKMAISHNNFRKTDFLNKRNIYLSAISNIIESCGNRYLSEENISSIIKMLKAQAIGSVGMNVLTSYDMAIFNIIDIIKFRIELKKHYNFIYAYYHKQNCMELKYIHSNNKSGWFVSSSQSPGEYYLSILNRIPTYSYFYDLRNNSTSCQ